MGLTEALKEAESTTRLQIVCIGDYSGNVTCVWVSDQVSISDKQTALEQWRAHRRETATRIYDADGELAATISHAYRIEYSA